MNFNSLYQHFTVLKIKKLKLLLQTCSTYVKNEALGTREIIREEDEIQPNGKVFK